MPWLIAAAAWGFAEATLFFIVPDVFLTWLAIFRPRAVWRALPACLAGALLGGSLMFLLARRDAAGMRTVLDAVPAISRQLIAATGAGLQQDFAAQLLRGGFTGVPYKIMAVEAGAGGHSLAGFLALSVPARLSRWILLVLLGRGVAVILRRRMQLGAERWLWALWAIGWASSYALYFAVMSG
jgi:membrane protein YqaA with SNARE-associated domain